MIKYRFKEGEEVYHKYNLGVVMTISRILKESIDVIRGIDADGNAKKESVIRMIGIECHWFEGGVLKTHKFHSHELIPKPIGDQGQEEVNKWLEANNK